MQRMWTWVIRGQQRVRTEDNPGTVRGRVNWRASFFARFATRMAWGLGLTAAKCTVEDTP